MNFCAINLYIYIYIYICVEQLEAANTDIKSQNLYVKKSRFVFIYSVQILGLKPYKRVLMAPVNPRLKHEE
jgi:hypothetical protein